MVYLLLGTEDYNKIQEYVKFTCPRVIISTHLQFLFLKKLLGKKLLVSLNRISLLLRKHSVIYIFEKENSIWLTLRFK